MDKELKVVELDELAFLIAGKGYCEIDGKTIPIGVVAEIMDLREIDSKYDDEPYPIIIEFSIVSLKLHKDYIKELNIEESLRNNKNYLIYESYRYSGGVPINIESVKSNKEDFSGIDSEIRTQKHRLYGEIKVRNFRNYESAERFIKQVATERVVSVFSLCGFYLDRPVNLVGNMGWDIIGLQAFNRDYLRPCIAKGD